MDEYERLSIQIGIAEQLRRKECLTLNQVAKRLRVTPCQVWWTLKECTDLFRWNTVYGCTYIHPKYS